MPTTHAERELTGQQRVAIISDILDDGSELTPRAIARILDMTWDGAEKLMNNISAVSPYVKENGKWRKDRWRNE